MCCWKNCRLTLYRRPIKSPVVQRWVVLLMACREGVEPSTSGIEVRCSVQLSYRQKMEHRVRFELTRTCVTGLANRRLRPLGYLCKLERVGGIEPPSPAWKAGALPLSYTRKDGLDFRVTAHYSIYRVLQPVDRPHPILILRNRFRPVAPPPPVRRHIVLTGHTRLHC